MEIISYMYKVIFIILNKSIIYVIFIVKVNAYWIKDLKYI